MILRVSAVSASAAWPQITGIKSRASNQLPDFQILHIATNLQTVLPAYQLPLSRSAPQELRMINL